MATKYIIRVGDKYNLLTIIEVGLAGRPYTIKCRCDCGKEKLFIPCNVAKGSVVSCGCFRSSRIGIASVTHGHSKTRTYNIWKGIHTRCTNSKITQWNDYGGRGISVCAAWADYVTFLHDMGECPSKFHSIERIETDGNYEPSNCRWATDEEQSRNKRNNVFLTHDGKTLCVSDWSRLLGFSKTTIHQRIKKGWPLEKVLSPKSFHNVKADN